MYDKKRLSVIFFAVELNKAFVSEWKQEYAFRSGAIISENS
jgi:hypothetical protein